MVPLLLFNFICIAESVSYILQNNLLLWDHANALCSFSYDTSLASIHNDSQNDEAASLCTSGGEDCWIGLTDEATNYWYWIDGSTFDYGSDISGGQKPWGGGEPSGGEHYVRLRGSFDYKWFDKIYNNYYYSLCNYPSPIPIIWDNIGYERIPTKNNSLGLIDILDEIRVEFDLTIRSWPTVLSWVSVLRIGNVDALRYPGIWLDYHDPTNPQFHCSFSRINNWNPKVDSNLTSIQLNTVYHLILHATQNHLLISVNNVAVFDGGTVSHSIRFDQNIYVSKESQTVIDGIISNLRITTSNSHVPNEFNYFCDYMNRFSVIKGNWTIDETNCILHQHNDTQQGNVVWLGDIDSSSLLWSNYKVELVINMNSGHSSGLLIRSQTVSPINNGGQQYSVYLHYGAQGIRFSIMNDGWKELYTVNTNISYNTDYTLRVEAKDDTFDIYLDNIFLYTMQHSAYSNGTIGLRTYEAEVEFKSLRITFPTNKDLITVNPTAAPTYSPTPAPTVNPTYSPSDIPTYSPTLAPTNNPTYSPSIAPTLAPSISPSNAPSVPPSNAPSQPPTNAPSQPPSNAPSNIPTYSPSLSPSVSPTFSPSLSPSISPTFSPSMAPTFPTANPSKPPTNPTINVVIPHKTPSPTMDNVQSTTITTLTITTHNNEDRNENSKNETLSFMDNISLIYIVLFVVIVLLVLTICGLLCCYKFKWHVKGKRAGSMDKSNNKTAEMTAVRSVSLNDSSNVLMTNSNKNNGEGHNDDLYVTWSTPQYGALITPQAPPSDPVTSQITPNNHNENNDNNADNKDNENKKDIDDNDRSNDSDQDEDEAMYSIPNNVTKGMEVVTDGF